MEIVKSLFTFAGGLGMFLYGMNIMADGLQKGAGNKMKQLMGFLTNNRIVGVLVGALVTAIIQSSSATTVMVVGFVNAGIINLTQAVGVIMGANIGTTVTGWLVSMNEWGSFLKPDFFAPVLIAIGAFILMFAKHSGKKTVGEILVGFGVLFVGLSFMSGAIEPYSDSPIFATAFRTLGGNPFLGILTGAVVTAIIQSSSASVGILQTLALNGMVTWNSAVYITLGQNIGTCITALLSSAGANKTAKRAAVIHLLFNMIGAVVFGVGMFIIFHINPTFASSSIDSVQISIFHTIFNITNTLMLFPFANKLVQLSGLIIRDDEKEKAQLPEVVDEEEDILRHLDKRILESPSFALENADQEILHMARITCQNVENSFKAVMENDEDCVLSVLQEEKSIDRLAKKLSKYLVQVSSLSLTEQQHMIVNHLFYTVSDIERIGDHAENIAELAKYKIENHIEFSDTAHEELKGLMSYVSSSLDYSIKARTEMSWEAVQKAKEYEDLVDYVESELREKHIERLAKNLCKPTSGVVFLDLLTNLERISDHADNMSSYVKKELKR
jgi:phosphate:Na+ symporter